jgi:hypothetical protein
MVRCGLSAVGMAEAAAVLVELIGVGQGQEQFVGKAQGQAARRFDLLRQHGQEQIGSIGQKSARQGDDRRVGDHRPFSGVDAQSPAAVVDPLRFAAEPQGQAGAIAGDERPIALEDTPVDACVLVTREILQRDAVKLGPAVKRADGVDHRVPPRAWLQQGRCGPIRIGLAGFVAATPKAHQSFDERGLFRFGKSGLGVSARPGRRGAVDRHALRLGDFAPGIAIGRMKPATAEIEREA